MKILSLIFLITLFSLHCFSQKVPKTNIVDIIENKHLQERRYYNNNNKLMALLTFDSTSKEKNPFDSVAFVYNSKGDLEVVSDFEYHNNQYEKSKLNNITDYYSSLISFQKTCPRFQYISSYLINNEIGDICNIEESILVDGRDVKSLEVDSSIDDTVFITFKNINSRFNNLSKDFQAYFFNQVLLNYSLVVKHNFLINEAFVFENGTLQRNYYYNKNKIVRIETVIAINNSITKICKNFSYY